MSLISDLRIKLEQLEQASITTEHEIKSSILHVLGLYNKAVEPITEVNATIKPIEVLDIADTATESHFIGQHSIADTSDNDFKAIDIPVESKVNTSIDTKI